jgi:A/G-specific adenine glycosylase
LGLIPRTFSGIHQIDFSSDMNFTKILAKWYEKNKRDLPWRRTKDPYRIWVSEIILQQTRIEQGWDYYLRFLEKFPDLRALSVAEEEEVLKLWQGLGYYSRARNMHTAAKEIMNMYQGKFPKTYEEIRKLKGIGDYTAAAISSIAFGMPTPVVDGNVLRLFSRFFGIQEPVDTQKGKTAVLEKAKVLISPEHPGDFNQAIMEFGALQCKPVPDCKPCPLKQGCVAFQQNRITEFPVKSKKQGQRKRYFHYLFITTGKGKNRSVFLKKRTGNDIWKNLFDFPLIETEKSVSHKKLILLKEWNNLFSGMKLTLLKESKIYRHNLTHQIIIAKFYNLEISPGARLPFLKVGFTDVEKYPVPRLVEKYLESEIAKWRKAK